MEGDAGADGVAVGAGADQAQAEPVILVAGNVDEQHGVVAEVIDDCFKAAVVEEVGDGEAAAGRGSVSPGPESLQISLNFAVAEVVVEEARFAIEGAKIGGVDLGVDVAVDDEEIGPAVVVDVGEHGAPAERVGVDAEAGCEGYVGEGAIAVVVVEGGGVVGEVGLEDVERAVAVVVGWRWSPCRPARGRLR